MVVWTILLSCFSYPITATIIGLSGVPSTPVNIALKIVYSLFYVFLFVQIVVFNFPKITFQGLFLFIFFVIYSLRLVSDISFNGIRFIGGNSSYVYSYFFGATLIPSFVILVSRAFLDEKLLLKHLFYILLIANLSMIFFTLKQSEGDIIKMLSYRVEIESEFSAEGGNLLNPIIISFFGASLSILSINLFLFFKNYNKFLLAFCVVLGIANLAFGASRGPFYSFFVLILATFAYKNFQTKFQISRLLKSISIFFLVSIVIYISLSLLIEIDELTIVKRITIGQELQEFGQEEYRNFAYQYAFQDFLEHPLLGNHFVGSYDQTYPHNVMIEVLMATGIVGGIFYFTAFLSFMVRFFYVFKSDNRELFIIFLICILTISLSLTSGSIFVNPESWILFSLALTIKIDKKA